MQTSNFIPKLDPYLSTKIQGKDPDTILKIMCSICQRKRLTISGRPRDFILGEECSTECVEPPTFARPIDLYALGFERTFVFPCGHIFGDRCIRENLVNHKSQMNLTCPTCGFHMTYARCGHAIVPALICARDTDSVRDAFPLTIPEGGQTPNHCKECRWQLIRKELSFTLSSKCMICMQQTKIGIPEDPTKHDQHRLHHVQQGIRERFKDIMALVQPDFITRETEKSVQLAKEERDERDVNAALLNAIALTELEETVWRRTATIPLSVEQEKRHMIGVQAIEDRIFNLLVGSSEKKSRRMW
ncbi:hypothetical protein GGS21DRAFT_499395 [Xylaria nigripes]|nr:hypothetical protein GGS21DRAFT_499395 [Xylaria nigripes]